MDVLRRLFGFLGPYWRTLALSVVLLLLRAAVDLVPPLFQRQIIDQALGERQPQRLGLLIGALVGVYVLQELLGFGDNYTRHALGERFIRDLRVRLYAYLQRLSLSFFEQTSTGELMSRVTNDVNALEQFVTRGAARTAESLLWLVGAGIVLFILNPRLAMWALLSVPVLAVACGILTRGSGLCIAAYATGWATSTRACRTAWRA